MNMITVQMREEFDKKFVFDVVVSDGNEALTYVVDVQKDDHERLTHGEITAEELVKRSFAFLLERESKEAILRQFDLMVIADYFPEYEDEIGKKDL